MSTIPPFRWAENATELWVTIEIPTAKSTKLDLTESSLSFTANEQGKEFKLEFPLKDKIDASASAFAVKDRGVEIRLVKAESAQGWWNKLTPDAAKFKQHMKVDWDLWADEDDEGEKAPDADFGQGGMGGMGGMGGGNFDLASLMAQMGQGGMGGMGGMPGMEGMGGMDMASLMQGMGGAGGMPDFSGMNFGGEGDDADAEAAGGDSDDEPVEAEKQE